LLQGLSTGIFVLVLFVVNARPHSGAAFLFVASPRLLHTHVTHPLNDQDLRAQPDFRSQYGSFCCSSLVTVTLFLPSITLRVTQFFNTLQRDICRKTACRKPLL
jgi:hypothetical protein